MNRRQFVFAMSGAVTLLAATRPGRAECGGLSVREFVETTYYKQARLHAAKTPLSNDDFYALFSPGMRRLMQAPRQYPKNQMLGPLLNAFFGYGVLPGADIKVGKVEHHSGDEMGPATIRVEIEHRGAAAQDPRSRHRPGRRLAHRQHHLRFRQEPARSLPLDHRRL